MSDEAKFDKLGQATLQAVLDGAGEGILVFDSQGVCRMVGKQICELFGVGVSKLLGKERDIVFVALSEACVDPEGFFKSVSAEGIKDQPRCVGDIDIKSPARVIQWRSYPVRDDGGVVGRMVMVRNATGEINAERSRVQLLQRVDALSSIDAITGLASHRRFIEEHEREHGRAVRAWDSYAVLLLDVDGMGAINERLGCPAGDQLLERVGAALKVGRRDYDVVARIVNDEFAILLPGADEIAALSVAERVIVNVAATEELVPERPTLCIGVAVCLPPSNESAADVFERAGMALRTAREGGLGNVEVDVSRGKDDGRDISVSVEE